MASPVNSVSYEDVEFVLRHSNHGLRLLAIVQPQRHWKDAAGNTIQADPIGPIREEPAGDSVVGTIVKRAACQFLGAEIHFTG
eukprot:tig00020553_g10674.t1